MKPTCIPLFSTYIISELGAYILHRLGNPSPVGPRYNLAFANSVEANWSASALFAIQDVNLSQQFGLAENLSGHGIFIYSAWQG